MSRYISIRKVPRYSVAAGCLVIQIDDEVHVSSAQDRRVKIILKRKLDSGWISKYFIDGKRLLINSDRVTRARKRTLTTINCTQPFPGRVVNSRTAFSHEFTNFIVNGNNCIVIVVVVNIYSTNIIIISFIIIHLFQ